MSTNILSICLEGTLRRGPGGTGVCNREECVGAGRGNSVTFYLSENGGLTEELVVSVLLTSLAVPKCVAGLRSGFRDSSRVPAGPARLLRPRLPGRGAGHAPLCYPTLFWVSWCWRQAEGWAGSARPGRACLLWPMIWTSSELTLSLFSLSLFLGAVNLGLSVAEEQF